MATLAPIANVSAPTTLGFQVPLDGGVTGPQTYTVTSDNASVGASVAKGNFLTIGVSHKSSGATDPSFIGNLKFQLFQDLTPQTVQKIEQLVTQGFYTSPTTSSPILATKNFHRVANGFPGTTDFIVQGGSQTGTGAGGLTQPGYPFADEFNQQLAFTGRGQLAMANAGDDTNDSQFFITTGSPRSLDFQHTIFGQLVEGAETLQRMTQVATGGTGSTTPVNPILITSTTLSPTDADGVVHLDLTRVAAGQNANVTVTATDANGARVAQTFQVNVTANNDAAGQPIIERPFLANNITNQVVGQNQTAVFQIEGIAPTPGDRLTYGVGGGPSTGGVGAFAPITNGTATVDTNGIVRVVPNQGFTGVINLLVGVRDQTNRVQGGALDSIGNYDTQRLSLTVSNGQFLNLKPIALDVTASAPTATPTRIQLRGDTANPNSPTQTLQYNLLSQPTNGTITSLDAATGVLTYLPNANFFGTETFSYNVTDVGAPTPSLTSNAATVTLTVAGAPTGAVRQIDRVLVVTPLPAQTVVQKKTNNIFVNQVNGVIQVTVNGVLDIIQPNANNLDRIVVFGSKAKDNITIAQAVTVETTLDGGHGGVNRLRAGAAASTMFGWFGKKNTLRGGPSNDRLTGGQGVVRFVRSGGNDQLFAGRARPGKKAGVTLVPSRQFAASVEPPQGTFYKFIGKRLVAIKRV